MDNINQKRVLNIVGAFLEITSSCNGVCFYCYNDSGHGNIYLPYDTIVQVVNDLKNANHALKITISGGEPMLHPQFTEIIEYILNNNIAILINTNANFMNNRNDYDLLSKCEFQVTLDSVNELEQNSVRGEFSYKNIAELRKFIPRNNNRLILQVNLTKRNYDDIDKFIELAIKWDYDEISFGFLSTFGRASLSSDVITYEDNPALCTKIAQYLEQRKEEKKSNIDFQLINSYPRTDCGFIYHDNITVSPRITCNGDVYPCLLSCNNDLIIGNIYEKSIVDILSDEPFQKLLTIFSERAFDNNYIDECSKCLWKHVCFKGCPAIAYARFNSFKMHSGDCNFLKQLFLKQYKNKINNIN